MTSWFNHSVFGYGYWPEKEKEVDISGKIFTLCPLTKEKQASFHIDLESQRISMDDAAALMNKFLSHLSWFSHQPYWLGSGFSGGVVKQNSFDREQRMLFEGMIVDFPDGFELHTNPLHLTALAFYRQAKVSEQYSLAYSCLSYYKILEIEKKKNKNGEKILDAWINQKLPEIQKRNDFLFPKLEKLSQDRDMSLSRFIFEVRNEAAHFLTDSEINLDDNGARELFGHAIKPLEDLATQYIEEKLNISDDLFSVSYHANSHYALNKKQNKE